MTTDTLNVTHTLDAPRDLVWEAWTSPEQLAQWWGPDGFDNPVCQVDAVTGGAIHIDMRGPDGRVYPMSGRFVEVTPPERLVFLNSPLDEAGEKVFEIEQTVVFTADGDVTHLTIDARVVFKTPEAEQFLAGWHPGWEQSFARLESFVGERVSAGAAGGNSQ
jgi:uncharacterized protein YndB with AHSA1/START domain